MTISCRTCDRRNLIEKDFGRTSQGHRRGTCKFCKRAYDAARKVTHRVVEERPSDLMEYTLRLPRMGA